ncbi:hypothetical protein [Paracoccus benzoatiresistens]|uniref:DUF2213 domain-containing protein n=1 Tax=Paracoccus benzoatiresistens TaxID=2997341 RepID=A0ABT4JB06_9RHOB|nr:hypothetical protein [Paracoccus sp. EF6]MCZ0964312.1 hypothetical protein [Paracoccus sp. EF6]
MAQVRVNVRSIANAAAVKEVVRNGRTLKIVPSATLPDDVVMNGILYPATEIEASFASLERTPAPLGHPTVNGKFVSATDPEGINIGYIGAWNENVRREGGRVLLDKVIDVEVANRSEGGKAVLSAIEAGGPIHTSTGLLANIENTKGEGYERIARGIVFDHDAILLNEDGAATPDQGVGMLVNGQQVEVINSAVEWADRDLTWAAESALGALERRERAGLVDAFKSLIVEAFSGLRKPQIEKEPAVADDKTLAELSAKVNGLEETVKAIPTTIANAVAEALKPVTEAHAAQIANQKAKDEAEKAVLVNKVVTANLLTEAVANSLTLDALRELAPKGEPGKAAALNGATGGGNGDKPTFKLPEGK